MPSPADNAPPATFVVYDCNSTNIRLWRKAAAASNLSDISIVPEYLPLSEGFLRQPDFFMDHYGAIERDIERIVDDMERQANEAGTRPQVIIEWIGFGGHARLSYLIHEHVADRFPRAKFLPVYCMPAERVLEQNIREHRLWQEAEQIIGDIPSLITDNRAAGSLQMLDERVALGLAAMEACYRFRPESGTMAETVSMFGIKGVRWLSLEVADIPYRVNKPSRGRRSQQPSHDQRMSHSAVVQSIKEAIWRIAAPVNDEQHTAYFRCRPKISFGGPGIISGPLRGSDARRSRRFHPGTGTFREDPRPLAVPGCWWSRTAIQPGYFRMMPRCLASDVLDWSIFTSTPARCT